MSTVESLTEAIPPQCRDCNVLKQRIENVKQRVDANMDWAISRALPALSLVVPPEDAQQEHIAENIVVSNGTDRFYRIVSQSETERRVAQSYLKGMEYHNEHEILEPALAQLGIIRVVCPGTSLCFVSTDGVSPEV